MPTSSHPSITARVRDVFVGTVLTAPAIWVTWSMMTADGASLWIRVVMALGIGVYVAVPVSLVWRLVDQAFEISTREAAMPRESRPGTGDRFMGGGGR